MGQDPELTLSQNEIDIIGEVMNISMGSAATALSNIMGEKVTITSPHVESATDETIRKIETVPSVGVRISFISGIVGSDLLIIKKSDVMVIVNRLLGEETGEDDFGEMHVSAISEVMNQMMGSASTALSNMLKREVNISPPDAFLLTEENKESTMQSLNLAQEKQILIRFFFQVENVLKSELYVVLTYDAVQKIVRVMLDNMETEAEKIPDVKPREPAPQEMTAPQPRQEPAYQAPPPVTAPSSEPGYGRQAQAEAAAAYASAVREREDVPKTHVHPVRLQSFEDPASMEKPEISNFSLIQDVPLDISVEVGRARKMVKEIIDLSTGSIIELDKQAGDPVDVIVNGQLIAKGEVVVIDESFGVRITEIIGKKNKPA